MNNEKIGVMTQSNKLQPINNVKSMALMSAIGLIFRGNMNNNYQQISDQDFKTQFENQTLDHQYFDHVGHIRIAWLYLSHNPLNEAINRTCVGIRNYAESLGAKDKFHQTITTALVHVIYNRISKANNVRWDEFLKENDDLVNDALSVLHQHFSKELLFSDTAKLHTVAPDIKGY